MFTVSYAVLLAAAFPVWGKAQPELFEPADFNVTQALLDQGFDAAVIPVVPDDAEPSIVSACVAACESLRLAFGDNRLHTSEEPDYDSFTSAYWALQQADVNPQCIFKAPNAAAISSAVLISRLTQCPFAAKSGGHSAFAGASSSKGGITISFADMNKIEVSADKKTVAIEPGNTWGTVYDHLADYEAVAIGGRVYNIGVGGLTLGGGISFFSGRYGWACDNVAKYTVVTASGAIVEATPTNYEDLYWALRGGGNNFGLVVNFDLNLYPLPNNALWGGSRIYTEESFDGVVDGFNKVLVNAPKDNNAGQWVAWTQINGTKIASAEFWYAEPIANATIFSGYDGLPTISDTTQIRTLTNYTLEVQKMNPSGLREIYNELTVKADPEILQIARDIFYDELPSVEGLDGSMSSIINQGISVPIMESMARNGGNALGLDPSDGPLYLIHMACWWANEEDDEKFYAFSSRILERVSTTAKSMGLENDYIYMNYASMFQDVVGGYGVENQNKLKIISEKYDPKQVFQTLQPGYFKLDGAPINA